MDKIIYYYYHYKLKYSLVSAFILLILDLVITIPISRSESDSIIAISTAVITIPIHIMMFLLWSLITSWIIASVHYHDVTGRSLRDDKRQYNRTYHELLSYFKDSDPYKLDVSSYPYGSWKMLDGVILGQKDGHTICRSSKEGGGEGANYALFALPGGGKTSSQIITSALRFGGSILAIDIKGDILAVTRPHRRIKVFAPDNPAESCHYNPLARVPHMTIPERRTFIEQMANLLIQDDKDGKYFVEGARAFFIGISLFLLNNDYHTSLPKIASEILTGNAIDWVYAIKESNCTEAQEYTNSMYGSSEINVAGCYSECAKAVRPFSSGALAELLRDAPDCLTTATLDEGYDIYIEIPQDKIKIYSPISSLMIQDFMTSFMMRPDKSSGIRQQPVLFLLDEFPQLQFSFDVLSAALSTLRSKCVSVFIAQQSIAQLSYKYGDTGCRSIIDTCSYLSIMSATDPESRRYFQQIIGSKKVLKTSSNSATSGQVATFSGTYSRGVQEEREPIFQPEDFGNLGDQVVICVKGKYCVADKTYYYK